MTNTNELTAKLKAAAIYEQLHTFMAVKPGDILALTEALEAENELNKHLELAIRKAEGCSEALRRRAESAEKRIAELEARTLTVKLPQTIVLSELAPSTAQSFCHLHRNTVKECRNALEDACDAAGLKLQIEGE